MDEVDLDAYFRRVGYAGPSTPALDTLYALHLAHPRAIAFENLDPLLRRPVRLNPAALEQKLIREGRGGYCYEHNLLFSHALRAIGFDVTWLAARVLWNQPPGAVTPRTHMLLLVRVEEAAYVADVGFGGQTLTAPLRLQPDVEQATPHELFRLGEEAGTFVMETRLAGQWKPLYRFDLEEQLMPDYEVANWYVSSHPASHFVSTLVAARVGRDRRHALRNTELAEHGAGGATERRLLTSVGELRHALTDVFGLTLPDSPELDTALERIVRAAPAGV
jgi:N-hydroxyarylamine O-acetyltransferase